MISNAYISLCIWLSMAFAVIACQPSSVSLQVRSQSEGLCTQDEIDSGDCGSSEDNGASESETITKYGVKRNIVKIWGNQGTVDIASDLEIHWQRVDGAASYALAIGFDEICSSRLLKIENINSDHYAVHIGSQGTYWACVDAYNTDGQKISGSTSIMKIVVQGSASPVPFHWTNLIGDYNLPANFANNRIATVSGGEATTEFALDASFTTCDDLSWTVSFSINASTGGLSGTAPIGSVGQSCKARVIARNGDSAIFQDFMITVTGANSAPNLLSASIFNAGVVTGDGSIGTPYAFTIAEGSTNAYATFTANDVNVSDILSIDCGSTAMAVELDGNLRVDFRPTNDEAAQTINITCRATDSYDLSAQVIYFDASITNVNSAPNIAYASSANLTSTIGAGSASNPFVATIDENTTGAEISFNATDPDPTADSLTLSCTGAAASMVSVDNGSKKITLSPSAIFIGSVDHQCKVSDGSLDSNVFFITFIVQDVNQAPSLSILSTVNLAAKYGTGSVGDPFLIKVNTPSSNSNIVFSATDPDAGSTLTVSCAGLPSWASFNSSTKTLSFSSASSNANDYVTFNCKANDGQLNSSLVHFKARLVKPAGTKIWEYNYLFNNRYNAPPGRALSMAEDSSGNIYLAGYEEYRLSSTSGHNWSVHKFSSSGVEDTGWNKTYGDSSGLGFDSYAYAVMVDSQDKVIVAGGITNGNNRDAKIIKYTTAGAVEWEVTIGGGNSLDEQARFLAKDASDNIYVAYDNTTSPTGFSSLMSVAKISPTGVIDSGFSISESSSFSGGLVVDASGNIYLGLCSYNYVAGSSGRDWLIKKFNSSGTEILTGWPKSFSHATTSTDDRINSLSMDGAGAIYAIGMTGSGNRIIKYTSGGAVTYSKSTSAFAIQGAYVKSNGEIYISGRSNGAGPVWMLKKFDTTGDEITSGWDKTFSGGGQSSEGQAVLVHSNGQVINAGNLGAQSYLVKGFASNGTEDSVNWDAWVTNYIYGNVATNDSALDSQGNIYVLGTINNPSGPTSGADIFVKKISPTGTEIISGWNKIFDSGGDDKAVAIQIDSSDNVYVAMRGMNLVNGSSGTDSWIKKFNSSGTEDVASEIKYDNGSNGEDLLWDFMVHSSGDYITMSSTALYSVVYDISRMEPNGNIAWQHPIAGYLCNGKASLIEHNTDIIFNANYSSGGWSHYIYGKYTAGGSEDYVFSMSSSPTQYDSAGPIIIDQLGQIFMASFWHFDQRIDRMNPSDGSLDLSVWGHVLTSHGTPWALASQPGSNSIFMAKSYYNEADITIYKFKNNGVQDLSWTTHPTMAPRAPAINKPYPFFSNFLMNSNHDLIIVGSAIQKLDLHAQQSLSVQLLSTP